MNDRSKIWKIVAIAAAIIAVITVIVIYRRQITEFINTVTEKVRSAINKPKFTDEEYDDFADI